jgi:hypothetical protein
MEDEMMLKAVLGDPMWNVALKLTPDARKLFEVLRNGRPHREVYHGRDGGWFVTYGGGAVSASAVRELVTAGLVASVYSNCPTDSYHVGRTLDVERTLAARRLWKRAAHVYVGDPPTPAPQPEPIPGCSHGGAR